MGDVYRAKDTKLHREVAVKVLRDSLANDQTQVSILRWRLAARV
jgi:hypothetical protein